MPHEKPQNERGRRVRGVRDTWRRDDTAAQDAADPDPTDGDEQRRSTSLGSLDRIRAEAPGSDLETRRAADALEREIERAQMTRKSPRDR